jgi:hypothetical protein
MPTEVEEIFERIKALTPPDKLRLAADLLEHKRPEMALAVLTHVKTELGAALALRDFEALKAKQGAKTT